MSIYAWFRSVKIGLLVAFLATNLSMSSNQAFSTESNVFTIHVQNNSSSTLQTLDGEKLTPGAPVSFIVNNHTSQPVVFMGTAGKTVIDPFAQVTVTEPYDARRIYELLSLDGHVLTRWQLAKAPETNAEKYQRWEETLQQVMEHQRTSYTAAPETQEPEYHSVSPNGSAVTNPIHKSVKIVPKVTRAYPGQTSLKPAGEHPGVRPVPGHGFKATAAMSPEGVANSLEKSSKNEPYSVRHSVYKTMRLDEEVPFEVDISVSGLGNKISKAYFEKQGKSFGTESLVPVPDLKVELKGNTDAFKIEDSGVNGLQSVKGNPEGILHWKWLVTPKKLGKHTLCLSITDADNRPYSSPAPATIDIQPTNIVNHYLQGFLETYLPLVKENWQWISVLLFALFPGLRVFLSGRKDSTMVEAISEKP
ncbi:MAG: hypothetical protein K0Q50_1654 [Vampirovibrio sp.]|jgi:hypothetical protein|nr:hypothetical protein [Vampirovibrio sp.]